MVTGTFRFCRFAGFGLVAVLGLGAPCAGARDLCPQLSELVEQAQSNFFEVDPKGLKGARACQMTRSLSGANGFVCSWAFPFRDAEARDFFEVSQSQISTCFPNALETVEDEGVNHPDSYTQRRYVSDGAVVRVSLKDKSALEETLVFMGVEGVPPG